jgi:hypothetical protein
VRVSTSSPGNAVTAGKADQLVAVVGLAGSISTSVAPAELPTQCLDSKNRGHCENCCKTAFGCVDPVGPCNITPACSRFCKSVLPPGQESPTDPIP